MTIALQADPIPLHMDEQGTIRVGNSRITLDVFVEEYESSHSIEALAKAFDIIELADLHAVLAWYLRHKDEVWAYLQRREEQAATVQQRLETAGMTSNRVVYLPE